MTIRKSYILNILLLFGAILSWGVFLQKQSWFSGNPKDSGASRFLGQDLPKDISEIQFMVPDSGPTSSNLLSLPFGEKLDGATQRQIDAYVQFTTVLITAKRTTSVDNWRKIGEVIVRTGNGTEKIVLVAYDDSHDGVGFAFCGNFYRSEAMKTGFILELINERER